MDSFIQTFHIDWKIIIAQSINFVIVLGVLYFFALKPIKKLMSEREARIRKGILDAKTNAETLTNTKKEYDAVIMKAKEEALSLFQQGKRDANIKKIEMLKDAEKEVNNMILNGKKVLISEKNKMIEEAKQEIVSLVVKATEKLLKSEYNETFDENTIDQIKKM